MRIPGMGTLRRLCGLLVLILSLGGTAWGEGSEGTMNERPERAYVLREAEACATPLNPDLLSPEGADFDDPEYAAAFDAWWDAQNAMQNGEIPDAANLRRFALDSARVFLGQGEIDSAVYSPVNLWFCLNLLSQVSAGESRAQILSALGGTSQEALSESAEAAWRVLSWDDGVSACLPNTALWLDDSVQIDDGVLESLAQRFHTSVFRGKMGDEAYDEALRAWLNRQTRGLLSGPVGNLAFDPSGRLSACATLYLKANWSHPFIKDATKAGVFHGTSGDGMADYMVCSDDGAVFEGERFTAVIKSLRDGGRMFFVLPREGTRPRELLADEEVARFLEAGNEWEQVRYGMVNLTVPKLDCTTTLSMREGLEAMGIRDLFCIGDADFSGALTCEDPIFLTNVEQYSRLIMDEEGVEAAAITIAMALGAMFSPEEIDFTLDRPFLFAVMDQRNLPLFMGLVENL